MTKEEYCVALFDSISHVMLAEKIMKKEGIPHKVIPVPRHMSSDCGICLRVPAELKIKMEEALAGKVEIREVCPL